jgi:hypothetical protein
MKTWQISIDFSTLSKSSPIYHSMLNAKLHYIFYLRDQEILNMLSQCMIHCYDLEIAKTREFSTSSSILDINSSSLISSGTTSTTARRPGRKAPQSTVIAPITSHS